MLLPLLAVHLQTSIPFCRGAPLVRLHNYEVSQHNTKVSCVLAEGLFDLDSVDFQQEDNCKCVPMQTQVIVDLMGISITRDADDVVAVLPLESGGNNLHVLLVAERELQRWGLVDRRFAARTETSMPRKKDGKVSMTYSLSRLEKAHKGASLLLLCHFCCKTRLRLMLSIGNNLAGKKTSFWWHCRTLHFEGEMQQGRRSACMDSLLLPGCVQRLPQCT